MPEPGQRFVWFERRQCSASARPAAGDTGDDYGSSGLWFNDATQSWTAGQAGDCIGLIVTSWSSTQVVFALGSEYANYPPVQSGDQIEVEVQGATFSGPLA